MPNLCMILCGLASVTPARGENDWAWSDGTEYEFTDWYQNNPNDVGERCGYVSIHFIHLLIHLNYLISFKMFNISNCEICEI